MRPIDANALKATMIETLEQIKANPKMDGQEMHIIAGIAMLGEMIDEAPTIDAVEVVRCRECRYTYAKDFDRCCSHVVGPLRPDGYCDRGERKEDNHETTDR